MFKFIIPVSYLRKYYNIDLKNVYIAPANQRKLKEVRNDEFLRYRLELLKSHV